MNNSKSISFTDNLLSVLRKINKEEISSIAIISPFRGSNTHDENESCYDEVKWALYEKGFGYLQLEWSWIEDKSDLDKNLIHEKSFFIETDQKHAKYLFHFCLRACNKCKQDRFIFYSKISKLGVYTRKGELDITFNCKQEHISLNNNIQLNIHDIEEMYSALRCGSHMAIKYTLENIVERPAFSLIDAYIRKLWLNN